MHFRKDIQAIFIVVNNTDIEVQNNWDICLFTYDRFIIVEI